MSGDKDLDQIKKEAAEKARAAALAKKKAMEQKKAMESATNEQEGEATNKNDDDLAKKKAEAAEKARAAALAKKKEAEQLEKSKESSESAEDIEKAKKLAAAKAKAAAAAKAKARAKEKEGNDEKAKAIAAAKAKAAAAAKARAKAATSAKESNGAEEDVPSPNQHYLDKYVKVIEEHLGTDVLEDFYINKISKHVPTLVSKPDTYYKVAEFLKYNEQLAFNYLSELHGVDYVTHMEVYVHLYSYPNRQSVALKVKIDRDNPEIDSLVSLWEGANWPECEAYDLLGIRFKNHPNLHRIFLGEDWVGYPLRKDYVPYDEEV